MSQLSLLLRGFGFWLGVYYAFGLGWTPLKLTAVPIGISAPIILAPVIALFIGSVLPDRALSAKKGARVFLAAVLVVGIVACGIVAANDVLLPQGANMYGFWFQVVAMLVLALLFLRVALARRLLPR